MVVDGHWSLDEVVLVLIPVVVVPLVDVDAVEGVDAPVAVGRHSSVGRVQRRAGLIAGNGRGRERTHACRGILPRWRCRLSPLQGNKELQYPRRLSIWS